MKGLEFLKQLKFPFPIKQNVYWGEMDAFGHINNVIYFRYFETGRINFFNQTGFWKDLDNETVRIVVVKLDCNFVQEIIYPKEIGIAVALHPALRRTKRRKFVRHSHPDRDPVAYLAGSVAQQNFTESATHSARRNQ